MYTYWQAQPDPALLSTKDLVVIKAIKKSLLDKENIITVAKTHDKN